MGSTRRRIDDRTSAARIRDAAIARIAEVGFERARIRDIAEAAGVSPGLVLHHFGSKDGLRAACDDYVISTMQARDMDWMATGRSGSDDIRDAYREALPLVGYLARALADDSPSAERLFLGVVEATERSLELGVRNGLIVPTDHPFDRAVLLVAWQMGAVVLSKHVARAFGLDPANAVVGNRIGLIASEVLTRGLFADSRYLDAAVEVADTEPTRYPESAEQAEDELTDRRTGRE